MEFFEETVEDIESEIESDLESDLASERIDQRHHTLLAEPPAVLLPPDLQLDRLSQAELQALCRQHRLRGCCCCSSISSAWTQRRCRPPGGGTTAGASERRLAMRRPTRWQANETAHYDG
jgi:hypothetical protein